MSQKFLVIKIILTPEPAMNIMVLQENIFSYTDDGLTYNVLKNEVHKISLKNIDV